MEYSIDHLVQWKHRFLYFYFIRIYLCLFHYFFIIFLIKWSEGFTSYGDWKSLQGSKMVEQVDFNHKIQGNQSWRTQVTCIQIIMSRNFPYRFCDIRKLMFTKFCDISSQNATFQRWQWCWWHHKVGDDFWMLVTECRCWSHLLNFCARR